MRLARFALVLTACACARAGDFVTYEEFGAVGDGKTDDQAAIVKAHAAANAALLVADDDQSGEPHVAAVLYSLGYALD